MKGLIDPVFNLGGLPRDGARRQFIDIFQFVAWALSLWAVPSWRTQPRLAATNIIVFGSFANMCHQPSSFLWFQIDLILVS
jgi:hypothetical protein